VLLRAEVSSSPRAFPLWGRASTLAVALWSLASVAHAQPETLESDPLGVEIHAFVSQGFMFSTENNYLTRSTDGSFEFTEAAINFTKPLTDEFRVGMQLFSRKLGPGGSYVPVFDWYYLDYRVTDWFGMRAGRLKIPFGLYNESNDVDAARVPVLLPQSIYPDHHRDLLFAVTGGELYGMLSLGGGGQLEYRAYGGTFPLDGAAVADPNVELLSTEVHYLMGARLMWLTPIDGLTVGGSFQALRFDLEGRFNPILSPILVAMGLAPMDFDGSFELEFPVMLWLGSVEYIVGDWLIAAEYSRWQADLESPVPALFPDAVNERYYVMTSYRLTTWFTPGVYYAGQYEDVEKREGRQQYRHDFAATLRFDLMANWLIKLEGHLMLGTANLEPELNDGTPRSEMEREWGLFLIKTTAYF
jgi:hypothetical protein